MVGRQYGGYVQAGKGGISRCLEGPECNEDTG